MTNEEFQKTVLEKLVIMETEIKGVKANMATRADVERIVTEQQKDIKAMLEIIDKKLSTIQDTQIIQGESINILALQQLQTAAEVSAFKKANNT